jgi:hypothetical protein
MAVRPHLSLNRYLQRISSDPQRFIFYAHWQPRPSARQLTTGRPCALAVIYCERQKVKPDSTQENEMLWTITIILFILWIVGLVSSYTLGGWIHILLVLAIIVLIFNLLSGRRAL